MFNFIAKQAKWMAVLWLVFISVLFFLPGSALPQENWLDTISFDKWVHFGFFFVLVFLWRFYFPTASKFNWIVVAVALFYGLAVEAIQHYFIANRSYDLGDVVADMTGAVAGVLFWVWYKKNRPL